MRLDMSSTATFINPPQPLPNVPGPKLGPFTPTAHADIEFIEELGNSEVDLDGHVWAVRINGQAPLYALKMFRFQSFEYLKETMGKTLMRPLASPRLYTDYLSAFSSECRVYGRLKEEGREDLAVRAHGYLFLTPEQEAEVAELSGLIMPMGRGEHLDGDNAWGRWEEHRGEPVCAIVKELVIDRDHFDGPAQVPDLWRDLEDLHALGILVRDVRAGNYLGGKLVDFSQSWTVPHPCFEYIRPDTLDAERRYDPDRLESAIIDCIIEYPDWSGTKVPAELQLCTGGKSENDRYGTDPRRYNWQKWVNDPEAVDAFLRNELYGEPEPLGE